MRFVVGYQPNRQGEDALRLALSIAGGRQIHVDLVVVLPERETTFDMYSPDRAYYAHLERQAKEWLDDAVRDTGEAADVAGVVQHADSITEGLIAAATDPVRGEKAALMVIGASHRGITGRFTVGGVAASVLHSASVPVALAPAGFEAPSQITRITCATGIRSGADALLAVAAFAAARWQVPLRLMSLIALGDHGVDASVLGYAAEHHAAELAEEARAMLPDHCPVSTLIGRGASIEDAVRQVEFESSEIVLVGSSRLDGMT